MKKSTMKKLAAAIGFLAMVFVFTAIPETKADAATIKQGVVGPVSATENGELHKLTMKKDGYIALQVASIYTDYSYKSTCDVTVYSKSKKRISDKEYTNLGSPYAQQNTQVFALKKGTYYIKIEMTYPSFSRYDSNLHQTVYYPNQYRIGTVIKYVSDQGGSKKSKATTIKLKKSKQGIIALTDSKGTSTNSKGDWYKFKLSKKTKVKLYVKGISTNRSNTSQSLQFVVQGKASYKQLRNLVNGKTATLPKGTYYLKLYKYNAKDSGYYKIGLNKKI